MQTKYSSVLITLFFALLAANVAFADFTPSDWMYMKTITEVAASGNGLYVKAPLDREVSFHAAPDLSDLRVVDSSGAEVPYQLLVENEEVRNAYRASTMRNLSRGKDGIEFTLDLGASGVISDRLLILSDSKNYKRNVIVYAADSALPADSDRPHACASRYCHCRRSWPMRSSMSAPRVPHRMPRSQGSCSKTSSCPPSRNRCPAANSVEGAIVPGAERY